MSIPNATQCNVEAHTADNTESLTAIIFCDVLWPSGSQALVFLIIREWVRFPAVALAMLCNLDVT